MNRQELFEQVIEKKKVSVLFQPIIDLRTAEVLGYEAFARGPKDTELAAPLALLETARELGKLCDLEIMLKTVAIEAAGELMLDKLLFLNVEPSVFADREFKSCMNVSFLQKHGVGSDSIVIELTERMVALSQEELRSNAANFQGMGVNVALNGMGSGFSNFLTLSKMDPKYIKIGASLVREIQDDPVRQSVVRAFVTLSGLTNTRVIAEGIESAAEVSTLIRIGVSAGQGYFLAKPASGLPALRGEAETLIQSLTRRLEDMEESGQITCIGSICEHIPSFDAETLCRDIKQEMDSGQYEGICLTDKHGVAGLLMKKQLDAMLSSQYGFSLFFNRPVRRIMDAHCIVADYNAPINEVADMVLARARDKVYDNVIITKDNDYTGMVTVVNLLKYAMKIQYSSAMECNPLTQLPGNNLINEMLKKLLEREEKSCLLYFDLNHFKAYNDVYGFGRGDKILLMAKNVICSVFGRHSATEDFIGHIGGDDFVVHTHKTLSDVCSLLRQTIELFDKSVPEYYNPEDRRRRGIVTESRNHKIRNYPLTQISIGGFYGSFTRFENIGELTGHISRLKKAAKGFLSSAYVIEDAEAGNRITWSEQKTSA